MLKRYNQKPRFYWLNRIFNRYTIKYWIIGGAVFLVALVSLIIYQNSRQIQPSDTSFYRQNQIVVGFSMESSHFATVSEDGEIAGFNRDLITELLSRIYPDADVVCKQIDAQEASYLLKEREIDLAIGLFTSDVLKTQGLSLSNGYFTDGIYAYAAPGTGEISQIMGKKVSVMTSDINKSVVTDALEKNALEVEIFSCSSYPDGIQAVLNGNSAALITTQYKMSPYEGLEQLSPALASVSYRILAWKNNSSAVSLLNNEIRSLREGGQLQTLREKWGLTEFTAPKQS